MRPFEDMPTLEIVDMTMLEVTDKTTPTLADMTVCKPVYQAWGFWILLAVTIVVSYAGGILIRTGSLFG